MAELDDDLDETIQSLQMGTAGLASLHANANPDDGARALELANGSGFPAQTIYADTKGFEERYKSQLAQNVVGNDPELQAFIRKNTLAPVVANDDWGNLSALGNAARHDTTWRDRYDARFWTEKPVEQAFWQGFSLGGSTPGHWAEEDPFFADLPQTARMLQTVLSPGEAVLRTGMGIFSGAAAVVKETAYEAYLEGSNLLGYPPDEMRAERFSREIAAVAEYKFQGEPGVDRMAPNKYVGHQVRLNEMFGNESGRRIYEAQRNMEQWVASGKEPPNGISELVDDYRMTVNSARVKKLNDVFNKALAANVRDRSPELLNNFMEQFYGDSTLSIPGDVVSNLYGDRAPHPEDGILGWVSNIDAQLAQARLSGEDVVIPIRDWIAKVDPKLAGELQPHLRMTPRGITAIEGQQILADRAERKTLGQMILGEADLERFNVDSPLAAIRHELQIEPALSIGDRKLTLRRQESFEKTVEGVARQMAEEQGLNYDTLDLESRQGLVEEATTRVPQTDMAPRGWDRVEPATEPPGSDRPWEELTDEERAAWTEYAANAPDKPKHQFDLLDHNGNTVGYLSLAEHARGLWVNLIQGINGMGVQDFGPALIRDLYRQVQQEFPELVGKKEIGGFRISGGREKADKADRVVWIPLSATGDLVKDIENSQKFHEILQGGEWVAYNEDPMVQLFHPKDIKYTPEQLDAMTAAREVLERVAPKLDKLGFAQKLRVSSGAGAATEGAEPASGVAPMVLRPDGGFTSIIALALHNNPELLFTARHEAMHYLYRNGFISDLEWNAAIKEIKSRGILDLYADVLKRGYPRASEGLKAEETIAESYAAWSAARTLDQAERLQRFGPVLGALFNKIDELFKQIKSAMRVALGRDPTLEDLFGRIESGKVGRRDVTPEEFNRRIDQLIADQKAPPAPRIETPRSVNLEPQYLEQLNELRANALGEDQESFLKHQDEIHKQYVRDLQAARENAQKQQKLEQSAEWKANKAQVKKEIEGNLRARPDIAADLLFSAGILPDGTKLAKPPRIQADTLTEEQKAALPRNYWAKEGLPADTAARLFGYTSRQAMIDDLVKLKATSANAKETPQERLKRMVKEGTASEMQRRFGNLENNIMEAAEKQALSDTNFSVLSQEVEYFSKLANIQPPVIDKDLIREGVQERLARQQIGTLSSERSKTTMGRMGDLAFRAALNKDWAEAMRLKSRQIEQSMVVKEILAIEQQMKDVQQIATKYRSRISKTIYPDYMNWIHDILSRLGFTLSRSPADLEREKLAGPGTGTFADFVQHYNDMGRNFTVPDFLLDQNFTSEFKKLDPVQLDGIHEALRSLIDTGREENKIFRGEQASNREEVIKAMLDATDRLPNKFPAEGKPGWSLRKGVRMYHAYTLKLENFFNMLDQFDEWGPWQQFGLRNLIEGWGRRDVAMMKLAEKIKELKDDADLSELISNPLGFGDPSQPGHKFQLDRGMGRVIMLNMGSASNLKVLMGGYKLGSPVTLKGWIDSWATKADWDWVQGMWDIIAPLKDESDAMYRRMGQAPPAQNVPPTPIDTPFGQYAGGYFPLIPHSQATNPHILARVGKGILEPGYFGDDIWPPAGYQKMRTGAMYPIALDLNQLPGRLGQVLHDIHLRPAVVNASKIFFDPRIQSAIRLKFGKEYSDLLEPYLRDVANAATYKSAMSREAESVSGYFRQNMIATVVGLNPSTFLKHTPTAFMQTINQIGPEYFSKAVKELYAGSEIQGQSAYEFIVSHVDELQRRWQNARETLSGTVEEMMPTTPWGQWRDTIMRVSSFPTAFGDWISAVPAALGAYYKAIEMGMSEGDAIYEANRAVRQAHGSTAMTNRPAIMRGGAISQWLTPVYNFYSHMVNKEFEMYWRSKEAAKLVSEGEVEQAMKLAKPVAGQLFAYIVFPALVGFAVASMRGQRYDSWEEAAAVSLIHNFAGGWVGIRDLADAALHAKDPSVGLLSTAGTQFTNVYRDFFHKKDAWSSAHRGRMIQDIGGLIGLLTGVPQEPFRSARFIHDVQVGYQRPRTTGDYIRGLWSGNMETYNR